VQPINGLGFLNNTQRWNAHNEVVKCQVSLNMIPYLYNLVSAFLQFISILESDSVLKESSVTYFIPCSSSLDTQMLLPWRCMLIPIPFNVFFLYVTEYCDIL